MVKGWMISQQEMGQRVKGTREELRVEEAGEPK